MGKRVSKKQLQQFKQEMMGLYVVQKLQLMEEIDKKIKHAKKKERKVKIILITVVILLMISSGIKNETLINILINAILGFS